MNKKTVVFAAACLFAGVAAGHQSKAYDLFPEGRIPFFEPGAKPERVEPTRDEMVRFTNVSVPRVVVVPVPGATKPTPAVVICPGGGYRILGWCNDVAQWLKSRGLAGVILKYRVPDRRDAALADAQRAVRWVRANAAKFNVDPSTVGILGFSAGANLAARTATNHRRPAYAPIDAIDERSCRPDFQMLIYPWDLLHRIDPADPWKGHKGMEIRKDDYPVGKDTPRAFLVQSQDDFCRVETVLAYAAALKEAGVGVELHAYEKGGNGGHGYGIKRLGFPTDAWPAQAERWLERFVK